MAYGVNIPGAKYVVEVHNTLRQSSECDGPRLGFGPGVANADVWKKHIMNYMSKHVRTSDATVIVRYCGAEPFTMVQ